jgi:hypothetical protein
VITDLTYGGECSSPAAAAHTGRDALAAVFTHIERGVFPPADGRVRVIQQPTIRDAAVLAFSAHILIAADVDPGWALSLLPPGDLSAPLNPPFLSQLCARTCRTTNAIEMLMYGTRRTGDPPLPLEEITDSTHPLVKRAHRFRSAVRTWGTNGGLVILGRGLAGRWEMAVEVDLEFRYRKLGRLLAASAMHLLPPGGAGVWCQVSPGHGASVRAMLAAGYVPVGSEALLLAEPRISRLVFPGTAPQSGISRPSAVATNKRDCPANPPYPGKVEPERRESEVHEPNLSTDSVLQAVISEVRMIFGDLDVRPDDNFFAIGGTSLDAVELAERLQSERRLNVSLEHVFFARDLRDLANVAHRTPDNVES